ncbi:hypothetical protein Fmac_011352 [Flemingia macrophylla]|uniref:Uncharacterized protein n=1 Tax=Flemingia macrophylla TaxID=520843 RepID=A0ABD1MM71_9FABA
MTMVRSGTPNPFPHDPPQIGLWVVVAGRELLSFIGGEFKKEVQGRSKASWWKPKTFLEGRLYGYGRSLKIHAWCSLILEGSGGSLPSQASPLPLLFNLPYMDDKGTHYTPRVIRAKTSPRPKILKYEF